MKHKLIQGYEENGRMVFAPKEGLNRASAAVLLYNALKENDEKITYEDDEKVTYDDENEDENEDDENESEDDENENEEDEDEIGEEDDEDDTDLTPSDISVSYSGDKAIISWDKITSSNFSGYKVFISRNYPTPVYHDNGYLKYITDRNDTSVVVKAENGYNGGDFDGKLKSGVSYYFSITVLYSNGKAAGNVVRVTLP